MKKSLLALIILFVCCRFVLAQSVVPPSVRITQLAWVGLKAEQEGTISNYPVNSEADLKMKNMLRTLHAMTIKNETQKTITAIEWAFTVRFDTTEMVRAMGKSRWPYPLISGKIIHQI